MISRRRFLAASVVLPAVRVPGFCRDNVPRVADVRTGYLELDDLTGGFPPGSLTVIAGPAAEDFACDIAAYVTVHDRRPVLYLTQDKTRDEILTRMARQEARWTEGASLKARLKVARKAVGEAHIHVRKAYLVHTHTLVLKAMRENGVQLVIDDGQEPLSEFKTLAKGLSLPVIRVERQREPGDWSGIADGVWRVKPKNEAYEVRVVWNKGHRTGRIALGSPVK